MILKFLCREHVQPSITSHQTPKQIYLNKSQMVKFTVNDQLSYELALLDSAAIFRESALYYYIQVSFLFPLQCVNHWLCYTQFFTNFIQTENPPRVFFMYERNTAVNFKMQHNRQSKIYCVCLYT